MLIKSNNERVQMANNLMELLLLR